MSKYQLRTAPPGWEGVEENGSDTWGTLFGTYETLSDAMLAAGHPNLGDWRSTVGVPDVLCIDWVLYFNRARKARLDAELEAQYVAEYGELDDDVPEDTGHLTPRWVIEAPTVAADFTALVDGGVARVPS